MQYQQPIEEPSTAVNVTVARQQTPREYLTEREIERLMKAAGDNRWGDRDATAILIAYRHGLRASDLVSLRWDDIDLAAGKLHVRRAKPGASSVHPIGPRESRALRKLQRDMVAAGTMRSPYVFVSERDSPLSGAGY
jgi:integrase